MQKPAIILIVITGFLKLSFGQNLIPNPGFEEYLRKEHPNALVKSNALYTVTYLFKKDTISEGERYVPLHWELIYEHAEPGTTFGGIPIWEIRWYSSLLNRIDTVTTNQPFKHQWEDSAFSHRGKPLYGVPSNGLGEQEAHGGRSYIEIRLDQLNISFLQVALKETLVAGKEYFIRLHASLAEYSVFPYDNKLRPLPMDSFGIYFSDKPIKGHNKFITTGKPRVLLKAEDSATLNDGKSWGMMAARYKAKGNEKYFVFGYYGKKSRAGYDSHYYLDDFSLTPVLVRDTIVVGNAFVLNNILFETGSHAILPSSSPHLERLVQFLKSDSLLKIGISGHTDNVGNDQDNLLLSEDRAKSVADFIIERGVSKDRIIYKGYGNNEPVADNKTEEGRANNRRVEFLLTR